MITLDQLLTNQSPCIESKSNFKAVISYY